MKVKQRRREKKNIGEHTKKMKTKKEDMWISVEDRLPEPDWGDKKQYKYNGYPVLAVIEYEDGHREINVEELNHPAYRGKEYGGKDKSGFQVTIYRVTHWMELPELPE